MPTLYHFRYCVLYMRRVLQHSCAGSRTLWSSELYENGHVVSFAPDLDMVTFLLCFFLGKRLETLRALFCKTIFWVTRNWYWTARSFWLMGHFKGGPASWPLRSSHPPSSSCTQVYCRKRPPSSQLSHLGRYPRWWLPARQRRLPQRPALKISTRRCIIRTTRPLVRL